MVCFFRADRLIPLPWFSKRKPWETGNGELCIQLSGQQCCQLFFLARRLIRALYRVPLYKSVKGLLALLFSAGSSSMCLFLKAVETCALCRLVGARKLCGCMTVSRKSGRCEHHFWSRSDKRCVTCTHRSQEFLVPNIHVLSDFIPSCSPFHPTQALQFSLRFTLRPTSPQAVQCFTVSSIFTFTFPFQFSRR